MNRVIKFRAWDLKNKIMIADVLIDSGSNQPMKWNDFNGSPDDIRGIPLQFTGLKDKNGVDIYEGDILAYGDNVPERAVIFENGSFRLADNDAHSNQILVTDTAKRLLVVGNIYESPELLKG